jgi:ferredoxin-NADP reductase/predicted pyridoxine 5'-phosphate oxidase superfamily flavin-nucleotide-binding protein
MAHQYAQLAFTETVRQVQQERNSRNGYASMDQGEDYNYLLSQNEADFIQGRDSFYMASVGETGWPYVQHRGGPKGFMHVLDESTLGFADFSGNRQYVSTGNFRTNNRISLFFMDYPNRRRLKMMGRIELVDDTNWELMAKLELAAAEGNYRGAVERAFIIHIEAFDWNCPQHITPRFSEDEVEAAISPLVAENKKLKQQLAHAVKNTAEIMSETMPETTAEKETENELVTSPQTVWGEGELPLVVTGVRRLTPRIRAYEFRHRDGIELPKVKVGAHLNIPLPELMAEGERHYSICSNPKRRDIYEIAVLKEEQGQGGSLAIHQCLHLGQEIHCAHPVNHFSLHDDDRPAVLIAGGIGITPIKAMAQSLQCRGNRLSLHYAGRSYTEMAFQDRLQYAFKEDVRFYSAELNQRLNIESIMSAAQQDAVFYVCGPSSLIDAVIAAGQALNIPSERIRYERFTHTISEAAKPIEVNFAKSNKVVQVAKDQTILDAALQEGINIPFSCKSGDCKSCAITVLEGEAQHLDNSLSPHERIDKKLMCPCVSRSIGERLVLDI